MMDQGFIVLLTITTVAVVQAMPPQYEFSCEKWIQVYIRLATDCKEVYNSTGPSAMFQNMLRDGRITGEEFIDELNATCRNPMMKTEYMNCTQGVRSECPRLDDIITDSIEEQLSIFCDNNQPSVWLLTVLHMGYGYNAQCHNSSGQWMDVVAGCVEELNIVFPELITTGTIEETFGRIEEAGDDVFQCVSDLFYEKIESGETSKCGSSWADMLLSVLLLGTASQHLGVSLGEDKIETLMALKLAEQGAP